VKAAVIHKLGDIPHYEDFPDPVPKENEILISVKASSVKNLDRSRVSGIHYASYQNFPAVVGVDGIGLLPDGTRVFANGITGMLAEKAIVNKNNYSIIPGGIDDITAAALPNTVMGAALALRFRAVLKKGETVLINGATGVTGRMAVQIARYYGAGKIIATGRNAASLDALPALGADEIVSLKQSDEKIMAALENIHHATPVDVVIDYTWGHPAELIISALSRKGLHLDARKVRFVTVGSIAGESLVLPANSLRSSAIEISGSGFGSLSGENFKEMNETMLPELLNLAAGGTLKIGTVTAQLSDIEEAWQRPVDAGKRLVIVI
jgi:NADPH:quinone reductase-like Zn-dependent oxidoreductase